MRNYTLFLLAIIFLALCAPLANGQQTDAERAAYLAKRAAEKAAAELAVKELSVRESDAMTPDDFIRLSLAYNELADNRLALDAILHVPDDVLAEKKQLELKAICFHNMHSANDASLRLRELAFIDRCLDRRYTNQGVWLWRKAKLVCQASVALEVPTRGDQIGSPAQVIDREQHEYSFELLERAFAAEPDLIRAAGLLSYTWPHDFPLLSEEPRFKELLKKVTDGK